MRRSKLSSTSVEKNAPGRVSGWGFFFASRSATFAGMSVTSVHDRPTRPRKVLVIKLRALGDTVLMTAPLLELQQAYKDAEFHVAVLDPWAGVFDHFPGVSKIWTYERHRERTARAKALTRL